MSELTIGQLPAALQKLGAAVALAGVRAMRAAAVMGQAEAVRQIGNVKPYQPVDTGEMRRSYVVTPIATGAVLENTSPQAPFMEFGTKPHTPPLGPLLAWAQRKMRGGPKKGRGNAAYALARGAQRSIARHGTAPRGFHAAAAQRFPEFIEQALRAEFSRLASQRGL